MKKKSSFDRNAESELPTPGVISADQSQFRNTKIIDNIRKSGSTDFQIENLHSPASPSHTKNAQILVGTMKEDEDLDRTNDQVVMRTISKELNISLTLSQPVMHDDTAS